MLEKIRKFFEIPQEDIDAFYDEDETPEDKEWWMKFTERTERGDLICMTVVFIITILLATHMAGVF